MGVLATTLAVLLATTACNRDSQAAEQGGPGGSRGRGGDRVVPVQVATVELGEVSRSVNATGTVEPIRTVGVVSQISGVLRDIAAEEGDYVQQGAVLARVDVPELEAQLVSAQAALDLAQSTAQRTGSLFGQQIITAAENEAAQAALAAARATRDQLRTRIGFATVRAPVSGVVLERRAEAGDLASPQGRLFTVADVSTLVVRVPVSELDVTALRQGDGVDVTLDALPGRTLRGTIRRVFPAADSVSRLVPVEVALTGAAARDARPGFLARVGFRLDPRSGVLLIPATAVLENPRGSVVYVVQEGAATLRSVQRGATYQGRVEITNGLAPGEQVVVAGNNDLREGSRVRVMSDLRDTLDTPMPGRDSAATTVGANR